MCEELIKIINKYFPMLNKLLDDLTDKRHKSYITYSIRTLILTKISTLLCDITSMNEMNTKFNKDVIEQLNIEEIRNIRKYIVKSLIK